MKFINAMIKCLNIDLMGEYNNVFNPLEEKKYITVNEKISDLLEDNFENITEELVVFLENLLKINSEEEQKR